MPLPANDDLNERREALMELIVWYRDEYHKGAVMKQLDNELLAKVATATEAELEHIEQTVDGWLDY